MVVIAGLILAIQLLCGAELMFHALNVTQHLVQGRGCRYVGDRVAVRRHGVVAILRRLPHRDRLRQHRRVCERSTGYFALFTFARRI